MTKRGLPGSQFGRKFHACGRRAQVAALQGGLGLCLVLVSACTGQAWNNPYPASDRLANVLYSSFEERPKHLDPARAYSSNEYAFIAQIYEPLLQYHFLKRPYQLIPLAAASMPSVRYFDRQGKPLPDSAPVKDIGFSEYEISLQEGIRYQPHPALAIDENGDFRYHALAEADLTDVYRLSDFRHTGSRELVADDYLYQIKRLANGRVHSPISGVMQDYIVGFDELRDKLAEAYQAAETAGESPLFLDLRRFPLAGVQAVDRYTLRIRLKGKYPQFVYWLAMPFFAPMPWEADRFYSQPGMDKKNITLHWYPIGTGPFMLEENNPNLRMVLARNPNFHGETYPRQGEPADAEEGLLEDAGKPMPFIHKAVYNLEKESIPYWNKFLQGYYDTSGVASDSFDQAIQFDAQGDAGLSQAMKKKGIELRTAVTSSIYYMGFNMRDPVVGGDGKRARLLRQAISIAVDYEEQISIFSNGRGVAAQGPLPPGIFGFTAGEAGVNPQVYVWRDGKPRRKPLKEAKKLLALAGYPEGVHADSGEPLVLYFDTPATGPDAKARLNWLRKQFGRLGIQLVVRATDYNRFQEKMLKGTSQIFQWGWNADYPDPENFLFLLYGPNSKAVSGGENAANYSNPKFDRLFEQMKNMENSPRRKVIIDEMVKILRQDAPWVWGFHPKAFSLHHAWYRNVKPNLMANNTLKYKKLDPVLRAEYRAQWNRPVIWPVAVLGGVMLVTVIPAIAGFRRKERSAAL